MPMSQAAMDGITANGHRWKHHISLRGQTAIMGAMTDATPDAEVEACAKAIAAAVKGFADRLPPDASSLADELHNEAAQLEYVADDGLDVVRDTMASLYDQFDFSRICVVK